jgi:hypothetical protein
MSKTYHTQTARFIAAIADAMPSDVPADVMQGWIERPKVLRKALTEALCPPHETNFQTWKQVTVGNLGNAKTARKQLKAAGIKIGNWGDDILGRATLEDAEATLDLVRVSVKELGLEDGATTAEIYAAAERHGLSLCPAEVAPQLWLQYPDLLPRGEWSLVAMEAIVDSGGDRSVFNLVHRGDGRWLFARSGHPGSLWSDVDRWVFVLSK